MSDRGTVDGGELEYEVRGSGEPVLLIHGAMLADAFTPSWRSPPLLITTGSSSTTGAGSPAAAECRTMRHVPASRRRAALLDHLGIEHAQSWVTPTAAPSPSNSPSMPPSGSPRSALLEPAGIVAPSREAFAQEVLAFSDERYARGDKSGAVELFLRGVCGGQDTRGG